ncbi:MAG TPA: hypothetical protein VIL79_02445, partial [Thermoleophilia bacterium]
DLEAAAARLREARQALEDKEAEIARLRGRAEAGDEVAPAPAAAAPIAEAPPAAETAPPVEAAAGAAKKPAAKRRAPAAKKPAAKKPTSRKKTTGAERPTGSDLIAEARSQAHAHSHLTG